MKRFKSFLLLSVLLIVACVSYGTDAGPPPQKPDFPTWQTSATIEKQSTRTEIVNADVSVKMGSQSVQQDINVSHECQVPAARITYKKYCMCAHNDMGSHSKLRQHTYRNVKPKLSSTKDYSGYSMIC